MKPKDEDYFNTPTDFPENIEKALKACVIYENGVIFFEERRLIINIYESSLF
jgi:hypothetical protein